MAGASGCFGIRKDGLMGSDEAEFDLLLRDRVISETRNICSVRGEEPQKDGTNFPSIETRLHEGHSPSQFDT